MKGKSKRSKKSMFRKSFLICFVFSIFTNIISVSVFAGIDEDLNAFYGSLGYDSNITSFGSYHGQEAGYYSGGSAVLRNKVRNLQIIHLDAPTLKGGCGGIDMFFGGFSFVNSEQLTKFFRQVMNNAVGYSFNLALETMVPEIAHAMQYIQEQAQKINNQNFSSCETAEALVGGMWPKTRANHQQVCQDLGTNTNYFADWAKARQGCGNGGDQDKMLADAAKNPKYEPRMLINKNIVWDAIKKSGFLADDNDTAMLLMSLTGTIVYGTDGHPTYFGQRLNETIVKILLDGGETNILKCNESDKCLMLSEGSITISKEHGLRSQIIKTINDIVVGTKSDTPITDKQRGFINSLGIPITKFTNVSLAMGNEAQVLSLTNYADTIAKDILKKYLAELLGLAKQGIETTGDYDHKIHEKFERSIQNALVFAESLKTEAHQDTQDLSVLIRNMHDSEREVTSRTSNQLKKHLNGSSQ